MAVTIRDRIEFEGITVSDETLLNVQLDDSAEDVIALLPESCLWEVQEEFADSGSGYDISSKVFLRAHKDGVKAVETQSFTRALRASGESHEATAKWPVYYRKGGSVYVLPDGGTVVAVSIPDVSYNNSQIAGWPKAFTRLVALHAAMGLKERAIRDLRDELPSLLSDGTLPAAPSAPVFSYTEAVAATVGSTTIGDPGTAPAFSGPSVSLSAVPAISDLDLTTDVSSAALVPPTIPAAPTISATDAAAVAPSATTIGALPTDPVYTAESLTMTTAPTISDLDIDDATGPNIQPPTPPSVPVIAYADVAATTPLATSISALPIAPTYTKPTIAAGFATALAGFDTRMTADDSEFAQQQLVKARTYLEQYASDVQNELYEYNKEVEEYRAEVQKRMEQARLDQERRNLEAQQADSVAVQNEAQTLQAAIANYREELSLFDGKIALYQAEVEAQVKEHIANTQNTLRKFQIQRETEIAKFQADIQDARNVFDANLASFQANANKIIRQAEIAAQEAAQTAQQATDVALRNKAQTLQAEVEDYAATLRQFQQDLALYQAKVQAKIEQFSANVQKTIQRSQVERSGELEEYGLNIKKALDDFNSDFAVYDANLREETEQARITAQELMLQAQLTTDVEKQNEIQKMAVQVQEYEARLGQYQADLGSYRAEVERKATVFSTSLERFKTKVTTFRAELSDMRRRFEEMLAVYIDNHRSTLSYDIKMYDY